MSIGADDVIEESPIPETLYDKAKVPAEEVSITEDRRGEISQLIIEGGCRQEVRSSIDQSAFLRFGQGSPSRQLVEEYATSILLSNQMNGSRSSPSSEAPSEYDTKDPTTNDNHRNLRLNAQSGDPPNATLSDLNGPSQQDMYQATEGEEINTPRSVPEIRSNEADSTRITAPDRRNYLGRVEFPKLNASQTTQTSDFSGKGQIDPNFVTHSDDLGISFHDEDTGPGGGSADFEHTAHQRTPTQGLYKDGVQNTIVSDKPFKSRQVDSQPLSRPSSAASDRSDSSFPDIKFLSSQVVNTKFQEFSDIKNERHTFENGSANDIMPPQSPSFSQNAQVPNQPHMDWTPPAAISTPGIETNGSNGGSARPDSVSFQEPISPPALSRPRQTRASSSLQETSRDKALTPTRSTHFNNSSHESFDTNVLQEEAKETGFIVPKGSQVVNLVTSSPEPGGSPGAEPEPEYSEMYADDSVNGDYTSNFPKTKKAASTRQTSRVRPRKRQASAPVAEKKEQAIGPGWVGGSQGPSRKPSGRFGGRITSGGVL